MDAFVVISSVEFTKAGDAVLVAEERKKVILKALQESKTKGATAPAALEARDRLVTDPEREPPLDVTLSVDIYLCKGV